MLAVRNIIFLVLINLTSLSVFSDEIKVLYLGNSHTFWHDLPQLTANLALANGDTITYEANTPGGCTLAHPSNGHLFNNVSLTLIDSMNWDYVVLQEHSLFAVIDYYKNTFTYPGANALDSLIKQNYECTKTIMQLIWAKKQGGQHCINSYCSINFDDFSHMQDSLTSEYLKISESISAVTAPTGVAWQQSIENGDPIELFDPDESHPSLAGHYLTACVYYAVMFKKSPEGIQYFGGLNQNEALYLQQIADEVVFGNAQLWNLYDAPPEAGFSYEQIDNTVHFYDESVNATEYLWDFGDGTTDTMQNPTHIYTESGQFIVSQTVSSNCLTDTSTDTIQIVITGTSGLIINDKSVLIYYNSTSDEIIIKSEKSNIDYISICDIHGKKMIYSEPKSSYFSSGSHPLKPGIYIVTVFSDNRFVSRKIVK